MSGMSMVHRAPGRKLVLLLGGLLVASLSACSGAMLPKGDKTTAASPCVSFEGCVALFDSVTPYVTTVSDLNRLGLNVSATPNMKLLNYLEISKRFDFDVQYARTFPKGVRECIQSTSACRGYDLVVSHLREARTGNPVLDVLHFERKTEKTGWIFQALFVIKHDTVVYKLMGGTPKVDETNTETKPLGLIQDSMKGFRLPL